MFQHSQIEKSISGLNWLSEYFEVCLCYRIIICDEDADVTMQGTHLCWKLKKYASFWRGVLYRIVNTDLSLLESTVTSLALTELAEPTHEAGACLVEVLHVRESQMYKLSYL